MSNWWDEAKSLINKGIDAYVDIETASQTRVGQEPAQVVRSDTGVYRAGQAQAVAPAGVSPWVWVGLAGVVGLVLVMRS